MNIPKEAAGRLARLIGRFAFQSARCLRRMDADEVHDVRVAIRRLDQGLKVFSKWVPKKQARKIRERLRAALDGAAAVRDCDVAQQTMAELKIPAADAVARSLKERRQAAALRLSGVLKRMVDSGISAKWRDRLELHSAGRDTRGRFAELARAALPGEAAEFIRAGARLARRPKSRRALHSFRISAKRLRYSLELFADLYGPALEARVADVRKVQTALGRFNDCVATRRLLKESGMDAEARRPLRDEESKRLNEFQALWPAVFGEGAAKKWRRFLERASTSRKPRKRAPARARRTAK